MFTNRRNARACYFPLLMSLKLLIPALMGVALVSCKKEETVTVQPAPVGEKVVAPVVVPPAVVVEEAPAAPTPPEEEIGVEEPMVPESEVVIGEEPATTPGQKLDNAIQQTGKGLQRLGEKIERKANEAGR